MRKKKRFFLPDDWKKKLAHMILHETRLCGGARILGGVTIIDHFLHTTTIYPSQETLANYQGVGLRSIRRWIKDLERLGYYQFERPVRGKRAKDGRLVYGGANTATTIKFPVELMRKTFEKERQNNGLQEFEGQIGLQNSTRPKRENKANSNGLGDFEGQNGLQNEGQNGRPYDRRGASLPSPSAALQGALPASAPPEEDVPLAVGDRAVHPKFGPGNITHLEGDRATVRFDHTAGPPIRIALYALRRVSDEKVTMEAAE
jgi:Helix-turn-helix domain